MDGKWVSADRQKTYMVLWDTGPVVTLYACNNFLLESVPSYYKSRLTMGFAVRVRSAGQKYGPTCHQRNRPDVTEFVTLVRLSSLGLHVDVLALAGYKRRKSALAAGPIQVQRPCVTSYSIRNPFHSTLFSSSAVVNFCLRQTLACPRVYFVRCCLLDKTL